jgi:hypothetical protein
MYIGTVTYRRVRSNLTAAAEMKWQNARQAHAVQNCMMIKLGKLGRK